MATSYYMHNDNQDISLWAMEAVIDVSKELYLAVSYEELGKKIFDNLPKLLLTVFGTCCKAGDDTIPGQHFMPYRSQTKQVTPTGQCCWGSRSFLQSGFE